MPFDFDPRTVRTVVTYQQDREPSNPELGDLWHDTRTDTLYVRGPAGWFPVPKRLVNDYAWYMPAHYGTGNSVFRLTFPFDSGEMLQVGTIQRFDLYAQTGTNSSAFGYLFGWRNRAADYAVESNIQKFRFPFDIGQTEVIAETMPYASHEHPACSSSQHGFVCGGAWDSQSRSTVQRFYFPLEGTDVAGATLAVAVVACSAINSSTNGYVSVGGRVVGGPFFTYVQRLTFPVDVGATLGAYMPVARQASCGANSSTHGFSLGFGGDDSDIDAVLSSVCRFAFPFDSGTAEVAGSLADPVADVPYYATNSTSDAYVVSGDGGTGVGWRSTIQRCVFPFDVGSAVFIVGFAPFSDQVFPGIDGTDFARQFLPDASATDPDDDDGTTGGGV